MTEYLPESVSERLTANIYEVDEEESHIAIDQELAKATGAGKLLELVCPAHVYTAREDGSVDIEYAACLECGTCLAVALPGVLRWHYPRSMMGVSYRQG